MTDIIKEFEVFFGSLIRRQKDWNDLDIRDILYKETQDFIIEKLAKQKEEILEKAEKTDYSEEYNFRAGGLPEKYLELVEMITRDAYFEGQEKKLSQIKDIIKES